jgi:hypothetical protein
MNGMKFKTRILGRLNDGPTYDTFTYNIIALDIGVAADWFDLGFCFFTAPLKEVMPPLRKSICMLWVTRGHWSTRGRGSTQQNLAADGTRRGSCGPVHHGVNRKRLLDCTCTVRSSLIIRLYIGHTALTYGTSKRLWINTTQDTITLSSHLGLSASFGPR